MEKGQKPTSVEVKAKGREARRLYQLWDRLQIRNGTLQRLYEDPPAKKTWYQLVLPFSLRQEAMRAGVISDHLGEQKTLEQLKQRFYWPAMSDDVKHWCQICPVCATCKTEVPKNGVPMQTTEAGYLMQNVAVGITGLYPESDAGQASCCC